MTPEENQRLGRLGLALHNNIITAIVEAAFWTLHTTISFAGIIVLCRRSLKPLAAKTLLAVLVLIWILATLSAMHIINQIVVSVAYLFFKNLSWTLPQRIEDVNRRILSDNLSKVDNFLSVNVGVLAWVGDATILWRTWAIWMRSKWFLAGPMFFYVAYVAFGLTYSIVFLSETSRPTTSYPTSEIMSITAMTCSLMSNLLATCLIGWQAYEHRKTMIVAMGRNTSKATRILLFLTEAGLIYFIIQIIGVALFFSVTVAFSPLERANRTWLALTRFTSVTYPAIVVLIVAYNRSLGTDTFVSADLPSLNIGNDIGTPLSFGAQPIGATHSATSDYLASAAQDNRRNSHGNSSPAEESLDEKKLSSGLVVFAIILSLLMTTIIPFWYRLFFLYIEPISALAGAYYAYLHPIAYLNDTTLLSSFHAPLRTIGTSTQIVLTQLSNLYLLFALNEHLVLSSNPPMKTWRRMLFCLLVADFGHLFSMAPLGLGVYWKVWEWNAMIWGSVGFVYAGALTRIAFLAGLGLPTTVLRKKLPSKL